MTKQSLIFFETATLGLRQQIVRILQRVSWQNLFFHLHLVLEDNLVEGDDGCDDLSGGQLALPLLLSHQPPGQNEEEESHNL